ncbi:hypothetical protein D3C77_363520 [compost metagenome]
MQTPALENSAGFGRSDFTRRLKNGVNGNAGDLRRPGWRFCNAIRPSTQDIRLVVALGWGGCRQGLLVVTDAIFIQEGLIDQVLSDHHMSHGRNKGGIGTGADRDPLILTATRGIGVSGIDHNHACMGTRLGFRQMVNEATTGHTSLGRVITELDD